MSSLTVTAILGWTLAVLAVSVGVQFIAYVIVNGSIFNGFRSLFKRGIRNGVLGAEKMHELFTCTLCMLTQVSIWLVGIPMMFVMYTHGLNWLPVETSGNVLIALAGGFATALVVGGLANILMTRVEYPSKRYNDLLTAHEDALFRIQLLEATEGVEHMLSRDPVFRLFGLMTKLGRNQLERGNGVRQEVGQEMFTLLDFKTAITKIDEECQGISCAFRLARCRGSTVEEIVKSWKRENQVSALTSAHFKQQLRGALDSYFEEARSFHSGSDQHNAFLARIYEQNFAQQSVQETNVRTINR